MKFKRPISVLGDVAFVPLTRGKSAIIDAQDVPLVEGQNWRVGRNYRIWYALSGYGLLMHRIILPPPHGREIDHIDHDGLNNRRGNLRVCTHGQNISNGRRMVAGTSRFRGISWRKARSKWQAAIKKDGKDVYLGLFTNEVDAARAYDEAALELHGEFAIPNFPRTIERRIVEVDKRITSACAD